MHSYHDLLLVQLHRDCSQLRDSEFSEAAKEAEDLVKQAWHNLVRHSEDRSRLIIRAEKFYQTADEVGEIHFKLNIYQCKMPAIHCRKCALFQPIASYWCLSITNCTGSSSPYGLFLSTNLAVDT